MKSIQFTLIIFLLVLTSNAQNPHNGVYFGKPNKNANILDLFEYYDKGYYLENYLSTTSGIGSGGWSVKTDNNLELQWENFLTHSAGRPQGSAVKLDDEGNRYTGGTLFKSGSTSPFVVKYNPCGEQEWCILLPKQGYGYGLINDLVINENEEIIVLLTYLSQTSPGTSDCIFLAALSKDGKLLWENAYASPANYPLLNYPTAFYMTYHNGEYYLSGYCYYAYPNNPGHFYLTPFFVGIDNLFEEKWILPFGMEESIRGRAYEVIPLNDKYLMGLVDHWLPGIEKRTTLTFFDTEGNVAGYNAITNESLNPEYTWNVTTTAQAIEESVFVSPIYFGPPSQKFWGEIIYDTSGNVFNFNVSGQHELSSRMAKTKDGKYIVGVPVKNNSIFRSIYVYKFDENLQSVPFDTANYVYDSLCPYPIQSGTIDLTDCMVLTSTDWIPTPQEYYARISTIPITIYPNPAKDNITFALENTEHHHNIELRCFNLLGMLQYQTRVAPNPNGVKNPVGVETNVGNWPPGMYIAVVYSDGKPVGRGKFVVQR
jgi:hypothetical protein